MSNRASTWMLLLGLLALMMSCRSEPDWKRLPHASGSLVFAPTKAGRVHIPTEVEVLGSRSIARRVVEDLHLDEELELDTAQATDWVRLGTHVGHRPASTDGDEPPLVMDVSFVDDNPMRAAAVCNAVLEAYIRHRYELLRAPYLAREENPPRDLSNDVSLLDRCLPPVKGSGARLR